MIPKHCIEIFRGKFTFYPTFISLHSDSIKTDVNKFFFKSTIIWTNERINAEGQRTILEKFIEYDSSGIMVYIKEGHGIFILTTVDRKGVADFMVSNLKK